MRVTPVNVSGMGDIFVERAMENIQEKYDNVYRYHTNR